MGRVGGTHAGQQRPHAREVVLAEQGLGIGATQEVHVRARCLLRRVGLQLAQKRRRVRRVDDHQPLQHLGMLRRQAPGHGTTPVMGNQGFQRPIGLLRDQRQQLLALSLAAKEGGEPGRIGTDR